MVEQLLSTLINHPSLINLLSNQDLEQSDSFLDFAILSDEQHLRYLNYEVLWKAIYYLFQDSEFKSVNILNSVSPSMITIDYGDFTSVILRVSVDENYYIGYDITEPISIIMHRWTDQQTQSCLEELSNPDIEIVRKYLHHNSMIEVTLKECSINCDNLNERLLKLMDDRVNKIIKFCQDNTSEVMCLYHNTILMITGNRDMVECYIPNESMEVKNQFLKLIEDKLGSRLSQLKTQL